MANYKSNDVTRIYLVVRLLLLFVLCNVDYKLASCEEKISDSKMNGTLHLETLVLVELICHLHITATVMIVTLSCQRLECLTDNAEMFVCSETLRGFRKKCNKKQNLQT